MKIIESPREAMQGIRHLITTGEKVKYINALLKVGFDTVDIGSMVSPKVIPQMADTLDVIHQLDLSGTRSSLMVLVVNKKGAEVVSGLESIACLSFPFSVSPAFLKMNLNTTMDDAIKTTEELFVICQKNKKELVVYISMAFGNPYHDDWNTDLLVKWVEVFRNMGIRTIALSNVSVEIDAILISEVFSLLTSRFPDIEFGLHLHTTDLNWQEKVNAAFLQGCRRFDSVINGLGGCPMTGGELLNNLGTENLISFLEQNRFTAGIDKNAFAYARQLASETFTEFH